MSTYIKFTDNNSDSLTHYGVKGMKWGKHKIKWKSDGNIKSSLGFIKDTISYDAKNRSDAAFNTRLAARDMLYNLATRKNKTNYFIKSSGPAAKRGLDYLKEHGAFTKASRTAFKTYTEPLKIRLKLRNRKKVKKLKAVRIKREDF